MRTGGIALLAGVVLARWMGGLRRWPILTLAVFWFTFGGHWLEIFFLHWLRPRLPAARAVRLTARIGVWIVGGILLGLGAAFTMIVADSRLARWPAWWYVGLGFVGMELLVHLGLQLRGRPSFYNGRA